MNVRLMKAVQFLRQNISLCFERNKYSTLQSIVVTDVMYLLCCNSFTSLHLSFSIQSARLPHKRVGTAKLYCYSVHVLEIFFCDDKVLEVLSLIVMAALSLT